MNFSTVNKIWVEAPGQVASKTLIFEGALLHASRWLWQISMKGNEPRSVTSCFSHRWGYIQTGSERSEQIVSFHQISDRKSSSLLADSSDVASCHRPIFHPSSSCLLWGFVRATEVYQETHNNNISRGKREARKWRAAPQMRENRRALFI